MRSEVAKCADLIRKELKRMGFKASVTSENFSGGNSVNVCLINVDRFQFEKVKQTLSKYKKGSFDSITDSYNLDNHQDHPQCTFLFITKTGEN